MRSASAKCRAVARSEWIRWRRRASVACTKDAVRSVFPERYGGTRPDDGIRQHYGVETELDESAAERLHRHYEDAGAAAQTQVGVSAAKKPRMGPPSLYLPQRRGLRQSTQG